MPSVGWRLVAGLIALGAVMTILVALLLGGRESGETPGNIHPLVLKPWAACVREVRHQFSGEEVEVTGPRETTWDASGTVVDVVGTARPGDQRDRSFACRVALLGNVWAVQRVVLQQ